MTRGTTVVVLSLVCGCGSPEPGSDWVRAFGYAPGDVHAFEVGALGIPAVPVRIHGADLALSFDTGDVVGVGVSSGVFDRLGLSGDAHWNRRNSAGAVTANLRVAHGVDVSVLRHDLGPTAVYELDDPRLVGLVGPSALGCGHYTVDYGSRRIAFASPPLPDVVAGFRGIPLVRSRRHPALVLVRGSIGGRTVLLELDTGKSRTVVDPTLASELGLKRGPRGVAIPGLRIGDLAFDVPSAKEVDQTGIDPSLPEPIRVGVGSDVLSRFVWTVDCDAGALWIPR